MRVHVLSDLHLEFGAMPASFDARSVGADLHLLAGDIGVGAQGVAWALQAFDAPTAYVFGNHEHYGHRPMDESIAQAREACSGTHLCPLERHELLLIPGARVLGATLWTNFALFGEARAAEAMFNAGSRMSDYRQISVADASRESGLAPFSPDLSLRSHRRSLAWLRAKLAEPFPGKTIVLTHHAPSRRSLLFGEPGNLLDAAYASDLDATLMMGADLWVHGHTHVPCDYMVGSTRVVSNPRGYYPQGLVDDFDPRLVVEI